MPFVELTIHDDNYEEDRYVLINTENIIRIDDWQGRPTLYCIGDAYGVTYLQPVEDYNKVVRMIGVVDNICLADGHDIR